MVIMLNRIDRDGRTLMCSWRIIQNIASEFGWTPEFDSPPEKSRWSWAEPWLLTDDSSRALARTLYAVIRAIENDGLSESLVELVKRVGVGHLRDFADFAFGITIGDEGEREWDDFRHDDL